MGDFIICSGKTAEHAFFHETLAVHLYTIEELCYYMETNLYLLDRDWIGEPLFQWMKTELGLEELGNRLQALYAQTKDVYACVECIFRDSGYYSEGELEELSAVLASMRGKTPMECRKMRGDRLLAAEKYRQAAYTYLELLQSSYAARMTEELQGNILHNLGVIYARQFLFEEAADCFAFAWKKRKSEKTREAYLYALNFVSDSYPMREEEMGLKFSVMRDAMNHFTEISDDPGHYIERREASEAAEAFDWQSRQTGLLRKWREEYQKVTL